MSTTTSPNGTLRESMLKTAEVVAQWARYSNPDKYADSNEPNLEASQSVEQPNQVTNCIAYANTDEHTTPTDLRKTAIEGERRRSSVHIAIIGHGQRGRLTSLSEMIAKYSGADLEVHVGEVTGGVELLQSPINFTMHAGDPSKMISRFLEEIGCEEEGGEK